MPKKSFGKASVSVQERHLKNFMYLVSLLECKMREGRSTKKQGHSLVVDVNVVYFLCDFKASEKSYLQLHITRFSFLKNCSHSETRYSLVSLSLSN